MDHRPEKEENVIIHDIRGQICPSSLLYTLHEVNTHRRELKNGTLKIIIRTDNRNATTTIPDAVSIMGYAFTVEKMAGGYYQIEIMSRK